MDNADVERILAPEIQQIADAITKEVVTQLKRECATLKTERDEARDEVERLRAEVADAKVWRTERDVELREKERAQAEVERLRAELRVAQPFHRDAIKERENERTQLRELRERSEALCKEWELRGNGYEPEADRNTDVEHGMDLADVKCANELRAVLAKVTP